MGNILGEVLPPNIYEFFTNNTMTGVASTVDEDGYPRGAPMSMFYALDEHTMLMAVQNRSATFNNAQLRGKIALTFISSGDSAFTIKADAQVFKECMDNSEYIGIIFLKIKTVKNDTADDVEVKEGIKIKFRTTRGKEYMSKILDELRSYSLENM